MGEVSWPPLQVPISRVPQATGAALIPYPPMVLTDIPPTQAILEGIQPLGVLREPFPPLLPLLNHPPVLVQFGAPRPLRATPHRRGSGQHRMALSWVDMGTFMVDRNNNSLIPPLVSLRDQVSSSGDRLRLVGALTATITPPLAMRAIPSAAVVAVVVVVVAALVVKVARPLCLSTTIITTITTSTLTRGPCNRIFTQTSYCFTHPSLL